MTSDFSYLGNIDLWEFPKTAYLCSDRYSAGSVLKSYDWASEMKKKGCCVISGFLSKLEKDVYAILEKGTQPIIYVLACSIYDKPHPDLKKHIDAGRLLVISTFPPGIPRYNRERATIRNQFIVDNADEIVYAHVHPGGMLEKLRLREGLPVRVLDKEDT